MQKKTQIEKENNTNTENNEINIENAIQNLKAFSQLSKFDKLLVNGKNVELDKRYGQCIRRWLCGDSREKSLNILKQTILFLCKWAKEKHTSKSKEEVKIYLTLTFSGLLTFSSTYSQDTHFQTKINSIMDEITSIKNKLL